MHTLLVQAASEYHIIYNLFSGEMVNYWFLSSLVGQQLTIRGVFQVQHAVRILSLSVAVDGQNAQTESNNFTA